MIPVTYYTSVFFLFLTTAILMACLPLLKSSTLTEFPTIHSKIGLFVLLLITIGFIGLRDPLGNWRYLGDTSVYTHIFEQIRQNTSTDFNKDLGFIVFMKICSNIMDVHGFYLLSAVLYVVLPLFTFKKWFGKYAFFAMATFVTTLSFWGFGINVMRNGLATSIFIFALGYKDKKLLFYLLLLLSITFHKAMLLPSVAYIIANNYHNTKVVFFFWLSTIPISLVLGHQLEPFVRDFFSADNIIADARAQTYFSGEKQNFIVEQRFRLDFIIYSAIPILIAFYQLYKKNYTSVTYNLLVRLYLFINGAWILLIYVEYTDRLAALSWFLMPIILIYPFILNNNNTRKAKAVWLVITGSLIFTLLMNFYQ